jgi:hypothetical protein
MLKVPFYRLLSRNKKLVGWVVLENGNLTCEPPDCGLKNLLQIPTVDNGQPFNPEQDPEGWIKALPSTYYGSYFWAGSVQVS